MTATGEMPSRSATSAARQARTSRRMSTARCLGGSSCSAAMNASRRLPRDSMTHAGSEGPGRVDAVGNGCNQPMSVPSGMPGTLMSLLEPPSPTAVVCGRSARKPSGRRSSRSGTAKCAPRIDARRSRTTATHAGRSPGRRPRLRRWNRESGSSTPAAHAGTRRWRRRTPHGPAWSALRSPGRTTSYRDRPSDTAKGIAARLCSQVFDAARSIASTARTPTRGAAVATHSAAANPSKNAVVEA